MRKWVYLFSEGNANMRELLGGKGANLAEMTNIGLPVPQGFTITTEACTQYYEDGRQINEEIQAQINEYIVKMEGITGKKFGDVVFKTVVPRNVRVSEAPSYGKPALFYDFNSPGAQAYLRVATEVIQKTEQGV